MSFIRCFSRQNFDTSLQYHLKYETVWIQMPNQNTNFLFNLFSLLSIFYSTFFLSFHWFVSLQPMFPLFLLQITLPHPKINGTPPSPIKLLSIWRRHHRRSEAATVVGLKPPLPLRSKATIPPWSEPISARAWSCSTARLMRILATTKSRS